MQKKAKLFFIIVAITAAAIYAFVQMSSPVEIKTEKIKKQSLIRSFKENAIIKSDEQIVITPKYSSRIRYIAKEGDVVSKGDLILELDNTELLTKKRELGASIQSLSGQQEMSKVKIHDSQLRSLDIAIDSAKKQVDELSDDMAKYKELYDSGAVALTDYEKIQKAYDSAKKELELKENEKKVLLDTAEEKQGTTKFYESQKQGVQAQISQIDDNLAYSTVYATSDAIVTRALAKNGGFANSATQILELSPLNDVIAVCDVLSSDAAALKIGQKVKVLQKIGEDTVEKDGEIIDVAKFAKTKISSLGLEEQRVDVKIAIKDMKNIIMGSDIDVEFESLHVDNVLTVAKSSVFEDEDTKYVWKIEDEKLKKEKITINRQSDYDYEVTAGLTDGDIIASEPNDTKLKEGLKVKTN